MTSDDPEDADLRREEAYELRHQRQRYRDGRRDSHIPMSAWTSGTWAKMALAAAFAAPGFWLAFRVPPRDGQGLVQLAIMAVSIVLAIVVTEILWRAIGPEARDSLRMAVFLLPLAGLGALFVWERFERTTTSRQEPGWQSLPRDMAHEEAGAGCAALGPGWRLPNLGEFRARAEHLRPGGRGVTYWADEPPNAAGHVFFIPVPRAGGPDFGFAGEGFLAYVMCLSEPPAQ